MAELISNQVTQTSKQLENVLLIQKAYVWVYWLAGHCDPSCLWRQPHVPLKLMQTARKWFQDWGPRVLGREGGLSCFVSCCFPGLGPCQHVQIHSGCFLEVGPWKGSAFLPFREGCGLSLCPTQAEGAEQMAADTERAREGTLAPAGFLSCNSVSLPCQSSRGSLMTWPGTSGLVAKGQ